MATWNKISKPNPLSWGNVPKPSPFRVSSVASFTGGEPIGLLLALTYSQMTISSVVSDVWIDIAKPVSTTYTKVPKAT